MKISRIFLVCIGVLGLSLCGFSQSTPSTANDKSPVTTPTTGTIAATFAISFRSGIPSSDTITCTVTAFTEGESVTYSEIAIRTGTRNAGNGSCYVPVPYSWLLQTPGSDSIFLTYEVTVPAGGSTPYPYRSHSQSDAPVPVPANGTVTPISVSVTL
jgi:hypothetical protein